MNRELLLLLSSVGLTAIITFSTLGTMVLSKIDPNGKAPALRCPQCVGFWVGLLIGLLDGQGVSALLIGFSVSLMSRMAASVLERIER